MDMNVDVYAVDKTDLYWQKEKISDMAFTVENRYNKAKTEKAKIKWWLILIDILNTQRKFEKRLIEEFGYEH